MHFTMLSAICLNLDQSKILSSGNGLKVVGSFTSMFLNPFTNKPWFLRVHPHYRSFENTVGIGDIAPSEQFLLFLQCFLPVSQTFLIFIKFEIVVYRLFHFGRV